ncbi:MAG TPA: hypothetical protein VG097_20540, partial [Gemmata sp.]|nr:hypothetical protein [Gemmata sp.]
LSVSPVAAPKPALKYLLLPEARDLNPGNQIPAFYKCFMEQHNFYRNKEVIDLREKWAKAPLQELAEVKELIDYGGTSTRQADYAARLESVDWAVLPQLKAQGIFLLLPDVQQLRELAQVLKVKLRGEIARKDFDAAIRTAQTMLALAHAFESHPTLIGQLVGMAITTLTIDTLEEFVQQPGAPNLFWALTDLPIPFISLRHGMEGERAWVDKEFDVLCKHEPLPEAEAMSLVTKLNRVAEEIKKKTAREWFLSQSKDDNLLKGATERLAKLGFHKDKLAKFSKLQLVMADDIMRYRVQRDEMMKWTNASYWQIPPDAYTVPASQGLFMELTPAIIKVKQAQARIQQRIDTLRIEEAVRAYVAANEGKFPASLDQIKLPLPIDPFSGKAYLYELKDGKAAIRGAAPADKVKDRAYNRVMEIKMQKP